MQCRFCERKISDVVRSAASECNVRALSCMAKSPPQVEEVLRELKKALDGKINNRLKIKDIRELEAGFYKEFGTQGMILAADFSHLRMWIDDKPYVLFLATTFSTVS